MKKGNTKITVVVQGKPVVNSAEIAKCYKDMALVYVDLKSKYCVAGSRISGGIPSVSIEINEDSIGLDNNKESDLTLISFPEFDGWSPILANIGRYTLTICFTKEKY